LRRRGIANLSRLVPGQGSSDAEGMTTQPAAYPRHRFPAEIISHAVWLYHVFSLSLRDVELILAERGVVVTHESIRNWCRKFGAEFAKRLRKRRPKPGDTWHLDEVFIPDQRQAALSLAGCGSARGRARHLRAGSPECGSSQALLQATSARAKVQAEAPRYRRSTQLRCCASRGDARCPAPNEPLSQ
jgi:putative transposase